MVKSLVEVGYQIHKKAASFANPGTECDKDPNLALSMFCDHYIYQYEGIFNNTILSPNQRILLTRTFYTMP